MRTEKYIEQIKRLPGNGKQIIGAIDKDNIIVYQAFNTQISEYAVARQQFGGTSYSFNRMSWIKPGFLWMMYRAGWGSKENQQHILRISLPIVYLKAILKQATITSYDDNLFESHEEWKSELAKTEVRLQWDPDHDPYGNKQDRKAIQIGMNGSILKQFCTEWISSIEDITDFVRNGYEKVLGGSIEDLMVPYEDVFELNDILIENRVGITLSR